MRESNKLITLYTQRFGIVYGSLQSVRELKSKMRFHTQLFSVVDVDLVRGREIWRVTGIHENISSLSFAGTAFYELMDRLNSLLLRLLYGEEPQETIWNDMMTIYTNYQALQEKDYPIIEIIIVVRMLHGLGYWDGDQSCIRTESLLDEELFEHIKENQQKYIQEINQRIKDTHM